MVQLSSQALLNRLMARARLRHMQALIRLMDMRNMGRAAAAMGITQPALSQMIADLEEMLETKLFLRHAKGVDPVPIAHDLVHVARRIVSAMQDGSEVVASRLNNDSHFVKVATTGAAAGALLGKCLPHFAHDNPSIQVQVTSVTAQELDACLSGDAYDVVCCRSRPVAHDAWTFTPIVRDELVVVCATNHPYARRDRLSLADLEAATWLAMPVGSVARQHLEAFATGEGWATVNQCHVTSHEMMIIWPMLQQSDLLALIPRSNVSPWLEGGHLVALAAGIDIPLDAIGFMQRSAAPRQAARQFCDALRRLA